MLRSQYGTIPLADNPATHWQNFCINLFPYWNGQQFDLTKTGAYSGYEFVFLDLRPSTSTTIWMFEDCLFQWPESHWMSPGTKGSNFQHISRPMTMGSTGQITQYVTQDLMTWCTIEAMANAYLSHQSGCNIPWKWNVILQEAVFVLNQRPLYGFMSQYKEYMAPSYSKLYLLTQLCSFFIKATFVYEKDIHNFLWVSAVDNFQAFAFLLHFCGNTAFTSLPIKFHKKFCFFLQIFYYRLSKKNLFRLIIFH